MGRKLVRIVWAAPVVLAALLAGPNGLDTAEACSGGMPGDGWDLQLPILSYGEQLTVATDGFVLLSGAFRPGSLEPGDPLPWVRVTTDAGDEIAGQLRVLRTESYPEMTLADVGWQSDEVLEVGALLKFAWSGSEEGGGGGAGSAPPSAQTIELEVVAEPTPLPTPAASLGAWIEMRHGVGELFECESYTSCGSELSQVPNEEVRLPAITVSWEVPSISGMVAWEAWAETSDPYDGVIAPSPTRPRLIAREPVSGNTIYHVVTFADDAAEHCVVMVVKDLRSGQERRSVPRCQEPREATRTLVDHDLEGCSEPPTPESLPLWCKGNAEDERCADVVQAGSGGQAGAGAAIDDAGRTHVDVEEPTMRRSATEDGCNYGPARGSFGLGAASLGVLVFWASRRRRASRQKR